MKVNVTRVTARLMELMGYKELFPPQAEAIRRGVERGKSLLVATPTASGKTFIGLVGIANRLLSGGGKAFYLVPLRSVASEKFREFKILERLGLKVGLSIGDYKAKPPTGVDVLITTYEKLDSELRSNPRMAEGVRVLVVDEIHYINDPKRGPVLESTIAKLLIASPNAQIIALSATVPNAVEIAKWLNAEPIISEWRPVPLREGVFKDWRIHYVDGTVKEVKKVSGHHFIDLP